MIMFMKKILKSKINILFFMKTNRFLLFLNVWQPIRMKIDCFRLCSFLLKRLRPILFRQHRSRLLWKIQSQPHLLRLKRQTTIPIPKGRSVRLSNPQ